MLYQLVEDLQEKAVAVDQACRVLDMSAARAIARFVTAALHCLRYAKLACN